MAPDEAAALRTRTDDAHDLEVIRVFVRLCKDENGNHRENCRELRFRVPLDLSQRELLEAGFAIDGNSATKGIVWDGHTRLTISDELRAEQVRLVAWLAERGYEAEFE